MGNQSVISIEAVIDYIESHLDGKLELETVAEAVHYSKYYLHRLFTDTVGMTIHDYVQRRQLTEAAKLLIFSDKPIIEIAFICGYESQQSFSLAFKAMYKSPPAEYREERSFYPLQFASCLFIGSEKGFVIPGSFAYRVSMSFLDKATYYDAPVPATIGGCISFVLCFAVMFLVGLLVFSHKKKIEN